MKKEFDLLLNEFVNDTSRKVDSSKHYYQAFVKEAPKRLYHYFDKSKYLIKASVGNGNKAEIPWLCIFNRKITTSAVQGIYICYLFKADMSGFYMVLLQGITAFKKYKRNQNSYLKHTSEVFKNLIDDNYFDKINIELNGITKLSKSYEAGTILSKYYKKYEYDENELINDLNLMKEIYEDIVEELSDVPYMDIIDNIIYNDNHKDVTVPSKINIVSDQLEKPIISDENGVVLQLENIPKIKRKKKVNIKSIRAPRKIDYLNKAVQNEKTGALGEKLALNYEKERLIKLGRADLANKVEWIAKEDDSCGYDIKSFEIDENNEVNIKYIEVKTTVGNEYEEFYFSKNEFNKMQELKKYYYVYRIYNSNTNNPKLFILSYEDMNSQLELTACNYVAKIKNVD